MTRVQVFVTLEGFEKVNPIRPKRDLVIPLIIFCMTIGIQLTLATNK